MSGELIQPGAADTQVVAQSRMDRLISDPLAQIVAPEFSPLGDEMSHCAPDGNVHVMALGAGGELIDPSGESDILLGPCNPLLNGPEWGFTATELLLAWTTPEDAQGTTRLALATRPFETPYWSVENPLPDSEGLRTPYPIQSIGSKRPWLLHRVGTEKRASMIYKLSAGTTLPMGGQYPTWVSDTYEIADVDPVTGRIVTTNAVTGQQRVVSGDAPAARFNPRIWMAPETGAEAALVFNVDTGCIELYDEIGEAAIPAKELCASAFGPDAEIISPELFILRQRSYVSFAVATATTSGIYVAGAIDFPGEETYLQHTSSDAPRVRRDPEPVVNARRAFVYYTAKTAQNATGFGVWQTAVQGRPTFARRPRANR